MFFNLPTSTILNTSPLKRPGEIGKLIAETSICEMPKNASVSCDPPFNSQSNLFQHLSHCTICVYGFSDLHLSLFIALLFANAAFLFPCEVEQMLLGQRIKHRLRMEGVWGT